LINVEEVEEQHDPQDSLRVKSMTAMKGGGAFEV
jgi:hypothetical protein